ncbi:uncharacterized protein K452DRAFT_296048 [Aplosporella prunicola CBS 121167]|uniref:Uncharacterized protein n=1 Tax=Aplosporella prunicola CBS 121167 TaxID=1176127 RepID=A0A6A6BKI4_9PEZI|nr:uncharacterized protein K452DRAFT_296048 [Aplosporella prunicola CBS 121167]KAF2144629.1 hypothetical protein K452DRAFT_296048 [Aplosporella prunicola CBS 121167]
MFFRRFFGGSKKSKSKPDRTSKTPTVQSNITQPEPPREFRLVTDTELGRRQDQIIANLRHDHSPRPAPVRKEYTTKPFYIAPSEEKLEIHGIKVEVVSDEDECYHPAPSLFVHTEQKVTERFSPKPVNRAGTPHPQRRTSSASRHSTRTVNSTKTAQSTKTAHSTKTARTARSTRTLNSTRRNDSSSRLVNARPAPSATGTITIGYAGY